jgi:hypothetical protein
VGYDLSPATRAAASGSGCLLLRHLPGACENSSTVDPALAIGVGGASYVPTVSCRDVCSTGTQISIAELCSGPAALHEVTFEVP